MLDLVVRGAQVVDGTGSPARRADVGVSGGRIVVVGEVDDPARHTIDAAGSVVAPGFVDIHTHLDAQVFWDPTCSPSLQHGVTTVVGGNCGFSVAPLEPADADYVMRMLARVEGMPLEALAQGVPWSWRTTADYLDAVAAARPVLNMGFLVGHSALRRAVMGDAAVTDEASPAQIVAMCDLLDAGLAAGGMGFSSSWTASHCDGDGNPVPSRAASAGELIALSSVLVRHPGTQLEFIPTGGAFEHHHAELMTQMSLAAQRPLNWNVLIVRDHDDTARRLAASDHAARHGARVVALAYPGLMSSMIGFSSSALDQLPGWAPVMTLEPEAKLAALADPEVRARLRAGVGAPGVRAELRSLDALVIADTHAPVNEQYRGRALGEIAAAEGRDPLDVLLDIAVSDELRTGIVPPPPGDDPALWPVRESLWSDDRVVIGASDAGAHLDMLWNVDYTAELLALARDRDAMGLEAAVRQLTDVPARLYGLSGRGRVAEGWVADLTVFDPERIAPGSPRWRADLPGGARRLYVEPVGVEHVIVGGVAVLGPDGVTGEAPGTVLRAGRDTETVPLT